MLSTDSEISAVLAQIGTIASFLESANVQPAVGSSGSGAATHSHSLLAGASGTSAARPLCLPRGTSPELVHTLADLGRQLRARMAELEERVDAKLVEFFDHLRGKEFAQLSEIAERHRVVPEGFRVREPDEGGCGLLDEGDDVTLVLRRLGESRGRRSPQPAASAKTGPSQSKLVSQTTASGRRAPPAGASTAFGASSGGVVGVPSARLQHMAAERDMAHVLQAHLHLLLESALTQADGTCAAVYVHDAEHKNSSHTEEAGRAPRFLHCVAKLNAEGKLPDEVSYASMNALVSVTMTGIAANMSAMDNYFAGGVSAAATATASSQGRAALATSPSADAEAKNWAVKHLNVSNCVIVPLRHYGCLIVADKNRRIVNQQANGCCFTIFDEHIAWATALLCDGLLRRYQRSLLLQHAWQPPAGIVSVLRPAALLNSIPIEAAEAIAAADAANRPHKKKQPPRKNSRGAAAHELGFSEKAAEVLAYMAGARVEGAEPNDDVDAPAESRGRGAVRTMPKALTVVRTTDEDYNTMTEFFAATSTGAGAASLASTRPSAGAPPRPGQTALSEEDLFQTASDYIHRLETLWRDSLATANAHSKVTAHYERQLEQKDELISSLESKTQALMARLVHIERERAAAAAPAAGVNGHGGVTKKKSRA